ncbi:hypothetical protein ACN4EG_20260 [Alkalinema pantanalense CENA528]|uniref:hypothetical protein n=1 Tax=Alkalinema pantanalense TaxID=1620705 RepID=UPI003D6E75EF
MESCLPLFWRNLRWQPRIAGKLGVYRVLIGMLILGMGLPAQAQSILNMVRSETTDGPPPPPTVSNAAPENSTPANWGVVPVNSTVAQPSLTAQAVLPVYRVLVNDNTVSLNRAKQIEPQAFITTIGGQQWIQVGAFSTQNAAFQQVQQFANQGIATQVVGVDAQRYSPGQPRTSRTTLPTGYYVVVPVEVDQINAVARRLVNLGVSARNTNLREQPLGLHFAIGVYGNRQAAEQLSDYLRSEGELDARVFYQP